MYVHDMHCRNRDEMSGIFYSDTTFFCLPYNKADLVLPYFLALGSWLPAFCDILIFKQLRGNRRYASQGPPMPAPWLSRPAEGHPEVG